MSWDVHQLRCIFVLIATSLCFYQGDCRCVATSSTRLCRESCADSAPEVCPHPSCSEECTYCRLGYYGPLCSRRCKGKTHCLHDNCVLLQSGRALNCSEGCKPGWRGLSCNTNCKHPCLKCDRFNGECVGRCREGYFGQGCSERCDENCLECEKESGKCTGGCMIGFYGKYCSQPCPKDCEQCDKISGKCVSKESLKHNEDPVTRGKDSTSYDDEYPIRKDFAVEHRYEDSSDSFTLILSGALVGVVLLFIIVITLLCKWKHNSPAKSVSAQESTLSDSCKPLTSSDPDHIYYEIQDVSKKPLSSCDNLIIPTQHYSNHKFRDSTDHIHSSSKYVNGGYLSPVFIP